MGKESSAYLQQAHKKEMPLEAEKQSEPFPIRGHRLFTGYFVPKLFQENGDRWVKNQIRDTNRRMSRAYYWGTAGSYPTDVLGDFPSHMSVAKSNKAVFAQMQEFLSLDDNAPILLIRTPDGICKTCVIGDHCENPEAEGYPDPRNGSEDKAGIVHFINVATWLGAREGDDFTIKLKPGRRKPDIESILTTKRTLAAAIKSFSEYQKSKYL